MLTFTDQQNLAKEISGLSDTSAVTNFKRDIQAGTARFMAKLDRPVDRQSKFASSVANQQYYQLPEDAMRISQVIFLNGTSVWIPLKEVGDETTWRRMNQYQTTSNTPSHFFVRGGDEFGLYPTPSASVTNGIELVYEPKHTLLTADDYTTGTVALTNGSNTVTGTSTIFTPALANGSYVLQTTDGSDGNYYKITGYSSGTGLTLENYYQGITTASATYRIGQVSKIPEEYQEAPVDYAMYRHYLGKNELKNATYFENNWMASLKDAENTYGMSTGSQIVSASSELHTGNPLTDISANMIRT
jgi:hypothetical protein